MHDLDTRINETFEYDFEQEGVFGEAEVAQLASELMELQGEAELEQFLGDLIKKAGSAVGTFINSPTGQALGGMLKSAARKALPMAGKALGGYLGGSTGAQWGEKIGGFASDNLEMENEMENEAEFETAKSFIRMAGDAVKGLGSVAQGTSIEKAVQAAISKSASTHIPALLSAGAATGAAQGRWVRRGQRIVLLGV
jgi:hypothetical protein